MLDRVFEGLANPSRRRILSLLGVEELSAGRIAAAFQCSRPAVSQHLGVLLEAGLLRCRSEGRRRLYCVNPQTMNDLRQAMEVFWADSLLRLKMAAEAEARQQEGLADDAPEASAPHASQRPTSTRLQALNRPGRRKQSRE